jgi:hypothetical protein
MGGDEELIIHTIAALSNEVKLNGIAKFFVSIQS